VRKQGQTNPVEEMVASAVDIIAACGCKTTALSYKVLSCPIFQLDHH